MLPTIVQPNNIQMLSQIVNHCVALDGDFWECGVYEGGTAALIHSLIPNNRNLFLFDSFEGLPQETEYDNIHKKGDFSAEGMYDRVSTYFLPYNNVNVIKGWIPNSFSNFTESKICFLHLDLDLYEGYKHTLEFVWPRLVSGGIVAMDDYNATTCLGAKKAVDDFVFAHGLSVINNYFLVKE